MRNMQLWVSAEDFRRSRNAPEEFANTYCCRRRNSMKRMLIFAVVHQKICKTKMLSRSMKHVLLFADVCMRVCELKN